MENVFHVSLVWGGRWL